MHPCPEGATAAAAGVPVVHSGRRLSAGPLVTAVCIAVHALVIVILVILVIFIFIVIVTIIGAAAACCIALAMPSLP
jgi:hypothetical protein